jgi:hypothetical protein
MCYTVVNIYISKDYEGLGAPMMRNPHFVKGLVQASLPCANQ